MTVRKLARAVRAAMPGWLVVVFGACLVIPGPFDELAALVVFAGLVARSAGTGAAGTVRVAGREVTPSQRRIDRW